MRRPQNLPGQLPLNFECHSSYLGWLDFRGENDAEYEATAQKFFAAPLREVEDSPIWNEIVYALRR